jgi:hypothetical protein
MVKAAAKGDCFAIDHKIKGGLSETVLKELIVMPIGACAASSPVITVTPVGKAAKPCRISSVEGGLLIKELDMRYC